MQLLGGEAVTHDCRECIHWWPNHTHLDADEGACQALGMLTKAYGGGCEKHFRKCAIVQPKGDQ